MSETKETKLAHILRENLSQTIYTDASAAISTFGSLLNADVTPLVRCYHETFSRDLHHDLKKKMRGDFETACLAFSREVNEFDARCLEGAFHGLGTNEDVATEILCTRTDAELKEISSAYNRMFSEELKARIHSEAGGNLRRVWEGVLGDRATSGDIPALVAQLYRAGEAKFGTDEKCFINILTGHDKTVVTQIAQAYEAKHGKSLVKVIKSEFSGDLEKALVALTMDTPAFYAERFRKYMTRMVGVDEVAIIRIMRSRKEKDLPAISEALENMPKGKKQPMMAWVTDKLSNSNFRRLLLCISTNFAGRAALA